MKEETKWNEHRNRVMGEIKCNQMVSYCGKWIRGWLLGSEKYSGSRMQYFKPGVCDQMNRFITSD